MADAALALRVFHLQSDQLVELSQMPAELPAKGFVWVGVAAQRSSRRCPSLQATLQRWTGSQLVDLHVSDLLNTQLPSHFDYTSWYDLLVFRRLRRGGAQRCRRSVRRSYYQPHARRRSTPVRWDLPCSTACW